MRQPTSKRSVLLLLMELIRPFILLCSKVIYWTVGYRVGLAPVGDQLNQGLLLLQLLVISSGELIASDKKRSRLVCGRLDLQDGVNNLLFSGAKTETKV